eukprot:304166-Pelagomonas_calceolata.AAC.2
MCSGEWVDVNLCRTSIPSGRLTCVLGDCPNGKMVQLQRRAADLGKNIRGKAATLDSLLGVGGTCYNEHHDAKSTKVCPEKNLPPGTPVLPMH